MGWLAVRVPLVLRQTAQSRSVAARCARVVALAGVCPAHPRTATVVSTCMVRAHSRVLGLHMAASPARRCDGRDARPGLHVCLSRAAPARACSFSGGEPPCCAALRDRRGGAWNLGDRARLLVLAAAVAGGVPRTHRD